MSLYPNVSTTIKFPSYALQVEKVAIVKNNEHYRLSDHPGLFILFPLASTPREAFGRRWSAAADIYEGEQLVVHIKAPKYARVGVMVEFRDMYMNLGLVGNSESKNILAPEGQLLEFASPKIESATRYVVAVVFRIEPISDLELLALTDR